MYSDWSQIVMWLGEANQIAFCQCSVGKIVIAEDMSISILGIVESFLFLIHSRLYNIDHWGRF